MVRVIDVWAFEILFNTSIQGYDHTKCATEQRYLKYIYNKDYVFNIVKWWLTILLLVSENGTKAE